MGLSASKYVEDLTDYQSPARIPMQKRIVDEEFDPRSPSCLITRTPIQVVKTPDSVDAVVDPRSPSEGIDRTPIYGKVQKVNLTDSPLARCEFEEEKEASQESGNELVPARYNSTEDLIPQAISMTPDGSKAVTKKRKKSKNMFKIHTCPSAKDVSPFKIKSTDTLSKSSPLASRKVDYNSPRSIVQRKQTDKLSFMKGHNIGSKCAIQSRYQPMQDDKENVQY